MAEDEQILFVQDEDINIYSVSSHIRTLSPKEEVTDHVGKNCKDFDSFDIYTHGRHMNRLVLSGILLFEQVKCITFYFDSTADIQHAKQNFSKIPSKFKFCLKTEVANRIKNAAARIALKSSSRLNIKVVKSNAKEHRCRIRRKQASLAAKLLFSVPKHNVGFDVRNMDIIPAKYLCDLCGYILRNPGQFVCCGARVCESCAKNWEGDIVKCPECPEEIEEMHFVRDKGFEREMHALAIMCSLCNWHGLLKEYENHLAEFHPNSSCEHCGKTFESANNLDLHKLNECDRISVPCGLKDYGCSNSVLRVGMSEHYKTEQHQNVIIAFIRQDLSKFTSYQPEGGSNMDVDTLSHTTTSLLDNTNSELEKVCGTIGVLAGRIQTLNEDAQRLSDESLQLQATLEALTKDFAGLKLSIQEQSIYLDGLKPNQEIVHQDVTSLKQKVEDLQFVSYDGSLTWKISNFSEKMVDAQSERQTSIYSPPFYSSPTGYKMRARLYLHGDGNARRTHMSLFFVLMRSEYDAILKFPFHYKVTFCLYDQSTEQRHIIDSFRPDIKSNSFRRPRSEMNIASGIPKFFPLAMIQQDGNPYVRDDTVFIKIMVDFYDLPHPLLEAVFRSNPGLPRHEQHNVVCEMKELDQRQQSTRDAESVREDNEILQRIRHSYSPSTQN